MNTILIDDSKINAGFLYLNQNIKYYIYKHFRDESCKIINIISNNNNN
jgi:hypothetical protein